MPRVGVMLSGCGVEDGSDVYETVLTILALERNGATVQAMAPDVEQNQVINHYSGQETRAGGEETRLGRRNVLSEAARIVRGKIISTNEVSAHELDGLILVGGQGAIKNLSTYARSAARATVNKEVGRLIREMNGLAKPIGAIGTGTIVVALALKGKNPTLTAGSEGSSALALNRLGATHTVTGVNEVFVDNQNNVVSTAGFSLAHSVSEAEPGINTLVEQVLQIARDLIPGRADATTTASTPVH